MLSLRVDLLSDVFLPSAWQLISWRRR